MLKQRGTMRVSKIKKRIVIMKHLQTINTMGKMEASMVQVELHIRVHLVEEMVDIRITNLNTKIMIKQRSIMEEEVKVGISNLKVVTITNKNTMESKTIMNMEMRGWKT
jgi:hypothetical protein